MAGVQVRLAEPHRVELDVALWHLSLLGDLYDLAVIIGTQDHSAFKEWSQGSVEGIRRDRSWPDVQIDSLRTGDSIILTLVVLLAAAGGPFVRLLVLARDWNAEKRIGEARADTEEARAWVAQELARRVSQGDSLTEAEADFLLRVSAGARRLGDIITALPVAGVRAIESTKNAP